MDVMQMRILLRYQWHVATGVFVLIAILCSLRLWTLRWIYMSSDVRGHLRQTVQNIADERGWLLSGLSVQRLTPDRVELCYRDFMRDDDPVACSPFDFVEP